MTVEVFTDAAQKEKNRKLIEAGYTCFMSEYTDGMIINHYRCRTSVAMLNGGNYFVDVCYKLPCLVQKEPLMRRYI